MCERKVIAKVSVTNNLRQSKNVRKKPGLKFTNIALMKRLDKVKRERAIGMLDARVCPDEVARRFGVHRTTINRLVSHVQDRFIRLRSLRNIDHIYINCWIPAYK